MSGTEKVTGWEHIGDGTRDIVEFGVDLQRGMEVGEGNLRRRGSVVEVRESGVSSEGD